MIETCVDGSNESARKGCNSLVGREWKEGSLENLGGSCALLKTRSFWCAREELQNRTVPRETRLWWTPNGNHTKRREGEGCARRCVILAKGGDNVQNRAREIRSIIH
jgi:hypothetical protein